MALRRDPIQVWRRETVLVAQAALVGCALLVVPLVEAFEGLAADQTGDKPWFIAGERGQDIDAQVKCRYQLCVYLGLLFLRVPPLLRSCTPPAAARCAPGPPATTR